MNYSKQRSLIRDIVKNAPLHPTAEWVYKEAKKEMPSIGLATVYRNLNALVEMGECSRLVSGDGHDRFDGSTEVHFHMKCRSCGALTDLYPRDEDHLSRLREVVRETFPEAEESAELPPVLLSGFCRECRKKRV